MIKSFDNVKEACNEARNNVFAYFMYRGSKFQFSCTDEVHFDVRCLKTGVKIYGHMYGHQLKEIFK